MTVRHLLTHTSGFTSWLPLYSRYPDKASRIQAVMDAAAEEPARLDLPLQRPQPDHPRRARRAGTGKALDEVVARADHRRRSAWRTPATTRPTSTRIAATEYQSTPDRGHGLGRGARRERLVPRRRRRPRRGVLDRRRPRGPLPGAAQRRQLRRRSGSSSRKSVADAHHQLQHRLPGRRPRPRVRARPALVHGRAVRPPHRGAHRLHRHLDGHRLRVATRSRSC